MERRFRAPWGKGVKWTTGFIVALFAGFWVLPVKEGWSLPSLLPALALGAVMLGTAVFAVRGYSVGEGRVRVLRPGWETTLELRTLADVEAAPGVMRGSIRLLGVGGLFAAVGHFQNARLGRYRAWATDGTRSVVLAFPDRKVVLTPDDPEAFTRAVREEQERLRGGA
jgi:hypothetical protein